MNKQVFYGWWITAASFTILLIVVGLGLYASPIFLVPLQEHFGWSRAAITTGSSIAALLSGITSPLAGVAIDRYGARKVMATGALVMGGAYVLLGAMGSLWHLYLFNAIAAIGLTCTAWVPNQTLISNWFDKKRGMAMGIALTGIGFGGLIMAPLAGALIERFGWRLAFVGLGSLVLVLVFSIILAVVRGDPSELGLLPDGDAPDPERGTTVHAGMGRQSAGFELNEAVTTRAFWILSAAHLLWVFGNLSLIGHLVAFLTDNDFDRQLAAATLGVTIGISVIGRLAFGYLADRFGKKEIMILALALHAGAVLFLFKIQMMGALPAFMVLFGVGIGGGAVLTPLLVGEYFGLKAFPKILGVIMISGTLGAAIGPVLTGRIYDVTGNYEFAFTLHFVAYLIGVGVLLFLRKPKAHRHRG